MLVVIGVFYSMCLCVDLLECEIQVYTVELESLVTHLEEENAGLMQEEVVFSEVYISCIFDNVGRCWKRPSFLLFGCDEWGIIYSICVGITSLGLFKQECGDYCISVGQQLISFIV